MHQGLWVRLLCKVSVGGGGGGGGGGFCRRLYEGSLETCLVRLPEHVPKP